MTDFRYRGQVNSFATTISSETITCFVWKIMSTIPSFSFSTLGHQYVVYKTLHTTICSSILITELDVKMEVYLASKTSLFQRSYVVKFRLPRTFVTIYNMVYVWPDNQYDAHSHTYS